ncbi:MULTISPECIES: DUF2325 domain-containing protein [unclassified Nitratiruptor]|uniref:DUF2325 domain-containing protein n=1 Tax=unclassified Nitratiruptor TaxID=2624044 RepID=UPI0019159294|nr:MULTISPECIES: DUF2325 domain-containing protein [unclassified Nitratiruptor]BCD61152.1 hypothetical protein NitYY0810_P14 [Nitratiruptor sp. YY08-10]BCD65085.1 hypothetical protein NitYY0814_P14 [Nitratiruptor sp. YY08-14]
MGVLVIGADKVKQIKSTLFEVGATKVIHFDCRKKNFYKRKIPSDIDMVVFITDYLSHNKMEVFKKEAKKKKIPAVYAKYSKNDLADKIKRAITDDNESYSNKKIDFGK